MFRHIVCYAVTEHVHKQVKSNQMKPNKILEQTDEDLAMAEVTHYTCKSMLLHDHNALHEVTLSCLQEEAFYPVVVFAHDRRFILNRVQ